MKRILLLLSACATMLLTSFQCHNEESVDYEFYLKNESSRLLYCITEIDKGNGRVNIEISPGYIASIGYSKNYSGRPDDIYGDETELVFTAYVFVDGLGMRTLKVYRQDVEFKVTSENSAIYQYIFTQKTLNSLFGAIHITDAEY